MNKEFSFSLGWGQVQNKDIQAVRQEIMTELGLGTLQGFRNRLRGLVIPNQAEANAITAIFNKYGITKIWGSKG